MTNSSKICDNFGSIDQNNQCVCPVGFSGSTCRDVLCGSLFQDQRPTKKANAKYCDCDKGWSGENCHGEDLNLVLIVCDSSRACPKEIFGVNANCNKELGISSNTYMNCTVTNPSIRALLKDQIPSISVQCKRQSKLCDFQFWIGGEESFACHLSDCDFPDSTTNKLSKFKCENVTCKCLAGNVLCGKAGSIDISKWLNSKEEGPIGPGFINCKMQKDGILKCTFEEKNMDLLITQLLGDPHILIDCNKGECEAASTNPDLLLPLPNHFLQVLVFASLILLTTALLFKWLRKRRSVQLPVEELVSPTRTYVPCQVSFKDITVERNGAKHLDNVSGQARSGKLMGLLGSSGSGKSTLLNVLSNRLKASSGLLLINGQSVTNTDFKSCVGYVQQSDALLGSSTVFETVLFAGRMKLPSSITKTELTLAVMEVLSELDILHLKDKRIGIPGYGPQLSGGERRRVSIACELIRNPSILILDEPTSNLDAYNAYNVIECLLVLASEHNRTVICSIHQPRSNIYNLFDDLILLSHGKLIYSGLACDAVGYFDSLGLPCPEAFNPADHFIDLTFKSPGSGQVEISKQDIIQGRIRARNDSSIEDSSPYIVRATQLANQFARSEEFSNMIARGESNINARSDFQVPYEKDNQLSFSAKLKYLSIRWASDLVRNPLNIINHYSLALGMALLCGFLFYQVADDLSGFQNRLGVFFFYQVALQRRFVKTTRS